MPWRGLFESWVDMNISIRKEEQAAKALQKIIREQGQTTEAPDKSIESEMVEKAKKALVEKVLADALNQS